MKLARVAFAFVYLNAACGSELEFKSGDSIKAVPTHEAPQVGVTPTPVAPTPTVEPTVLPTTTPSPDIPTPIPTTVPTVEPTPVPTVPSIGFSFTEVLELDKKKKPIDMVWVIDNSSSMDDNVAKVRENFQSFLNTVQSRTDLRLALISESGTTGAKMKLSDEAIKAGHIQISNYVGSHTAMMIAAAAACPKNTSSVSDINGGTICDVRVDNTDWAVDVIEDTAVNKAAGTLSNFFRKEAEHVFVFVTDDDALGFGAAEFTEALRNAGHIENFKAFAFACKDDGATCDGGVGYQYNFLSEKRGNVFDLRDDWDQSFDDLTKEIFELGARDYPLKKKNIAQILAVKIGNDALKPSEYELIDKKALRIKSSAIKDINAKVTVSYVYIRDPKDDTGGN